MLNFQDVQREVGHQNANRWEELWYDLAVADGYRAGVPIDAFHWDFRTSSPDGGRDILVDRGAPRPGALFVPDHPSIWSVKSGANGVLDQTLREELDRHSHPTLTSAIASGRTYFYCLCHSAGIEARNALRRAADECCSALGVPGDRVRLLFDNHVCDGLKTYPAVLKLHCPNLSRLMGRTLAQWGRPNPHFDTNVEYVDIGDRRALIGRLVDHLGSADASPVLHIAGLSGIGKTRLVYEVCRDTRVPHSLMYFERYEDCFDLVRHISDNERLSVAFVVDEVSLDEHIELRNKLHGFGARVRAISIGPAGTRDDSRDTIVVLRPPDTDSGVLAVLKHHAPATVPEDGLKHIAYQSAHDLRFALLMLHAVVREPSLLADSGALVHALQDTTSLFRRVITQFSAGHALDATFADRYPWLTLGAHIGVASPREAELAFVAERASCPLVDLEATVAQAIACGLGDQPAHLFEAVPRGMATRIFAQILWPVIAPRFAELLDAVPDDIFKRSIMQRAEMCPESVKKEVVSRFDGHFHSRLGPPALATLQAEGSTRTLRSWAELSPHSGLPWLHRAIEQASHDELLALEGAGKFGWGRAGPRREIVWLLEHLACFAEHYATCEAILFRLALAENESIGNSATAVWTERHRIRLSNTQMPYPDRMAILLRRIGDATVGTMPLLMKAFVEAVSSPQSIMAPPTTVGGRLVPREWTPQRDEVYSLLTTTIIDGLKAIARLPNPLQRVARNAIASDLSAFYKESTHSHLADFFGTALDSEERLGLAEALEELRDRLRDDGNPRVIALSEHVSTWLERITPYDLGERVRLIVRRAPWSYDTGADTGRDAWKAPYRAIVSELRGSIVTLRQLTEWLDNSTEGGLWSLGWMLGSEGSAGEFDGLVEEWLRAGRCLEVCTGFLTARRVGQLHIPDWASAALDSLVNSAPLIATRMTIAVDPTHRGWARVRQCVEQSLDAVSHSLGRLFGEEWEVVLGPAGQAWILDRLWPESAPRSDDCGTTALHLMQMFRHRREQEPVDRTLLPVVRRLVLSPPSLGRSHNAHVWKQLALVVAREDPSAVISCATHLALDVRARRTVGDREAIGVLHSLVGEHDRLIIGSVLETLAAQRYLVPVGIADLQQLFTALNTESVAQAVCAKGIEAARSIGQLMPDPAVNSNGTALLPPVTEWYMRTYGDDEDCFRQFCIGRWNGRMQAGWAWERTSEVMRLLNAYAEHPLPSLRRWAELSRRDHEAQVKRDRIECEDDKR